MYSQNTYKYRILVPFWIVHFILLFAFVAVFAVDMMEVAGDIGYEPPAYSVTMFFFCIALISEPLEMVLQSFRLLQPWVYLSSQVYKALLTTIIFVVEIVAYTQNNLNKISWLKWVEIVLLLELALMAVSFYASLAYGVIVFRRHRKNGGFSSVKQRFDDDD